MIMSTIPPPPRLSYASIKAIKQMNHLSHTDKIYFCWQLDNRY